MTDVLDIDVVDRELAAEIALVADLMVAATQTHGRMDPAVIDSILAEPR